MIEIVLGIWVSSFIGSWVLVLWNYRRVKKQLFSQEFTQLNQNLAQIDMHWSWSQGRLQRGGLEVLQLEQKRALRSCLFLGLLSFASIIGFILTGVAVFSMAFLLKDKVERSILESDLATKAKLTPFDIRQHLQELKLEIP